MSELLVTIILAVCPPSTDGGTNQCMEEINNCAVQLNGEITPDSVRECVEIYEERSR